MAKKSASVLALDQIENAIYKELKEYGFRKHGRTLCRFVGPEADIAQIITFQLGQAYRDETNLLTVQLGLRIPEVFERDFTRPIEKKKRYRAHEATMGVSLGRLDGNEEREFNLLVENLKDVEREILDDLVGKALPIFDVLNSRESILTRRREFPNFDVGGRPGKSFEEAFVYGRLGDMERANKAFAEYYDNLIGQRDAAPDKGEYMGYERFREFKEEIAKKNGLVIPR